MKIIKTGLEGAIMLETDVFGDNRGYFTESYNKLRFEEAGIDCAFIQENHSFSQAAGTLRGLHYQLAPMAQTKLVQVVTGAIYDVVVDIRQGSPSYGQWTGVILSESNNRLLLVPRGFAHGFCTLTANTHVFYKVDQYYSKTHDRGILWSDPELGIVWPSSDLVLSDKDKLHPCLQDADNNFHIE
ncbi:dTDP-4-dehydrorhamnose 3,5-epimerase [Paenibacillus spongiae]|uniref:dTDP-4-dehydrorhamnose 3,5-epimerase n=1 Tax=Paenibacillus spongiae TaxID=2909671 RepID=A0ABY5SCX2_9BACL|nr:dTDP-4-dehydrorhamnose 3,5-epimerase [Paenibacillus spongiae]UVI31624.1 dTDP-4-dehydrorhamnose 3,5-epimerase [Paenibacillus spongiae]